MAIEPKSMGNSQFEDPEAFERVWPRPSKTPSDDTLLGGSAVAPEAEGRKKKKKTYTFPYSVRGSQSQGLTSQDVERVWGNSDAQGSRKGDQKDEIELQNRETRAQSS